jgi:hypothetical protein
MEFCVGIALFLNQNTQSHGKVFKEISAKSKKSNGGI